MKSRAFLNSVDHFSHVTSIVRFRETSSCYLPHILAEKYTIELQRKSLDVRLNLQLHKYVWGADARGV